MTDKTKLDAPEEHDGRTDRGNGADTDTTASPADHAPAAASRTASQPKLPLITALEIENFKGIGAPVRIDLRPITLLFGRNSAGKSTILQALCYAHEILSHRNIDAYKTELGGDQIDLGGFRQFVHGHDLDRTVRLRFELNLEGWTIPDPLMKMLGTRIRATTRTVDGREFQNLIMATSDDPDVQAYPIRGLHSFFLQHYFSTDTKKGWVELTVRWDRARDGAVVDGYEVGIDGSLIGRMQERNAGGVELLANLAHPLLGLGEEEKKIGTAAGADRAGEASGPASDERLCRRLDVRGHETPIPQWNELLMLGPDDVSKEHVQLFEKIDELASMALVGLGISVRDALNELRYLGPLRDIHPHTHLDAERSGAVRWANGSAAWNLLNDDAVGDATLVRNTSDWLSSKHRLDAGYELRLQSAVDLRILGSKPPGKVEIDLKRMVPGASDTASDVVRTVEPSPADDSVGGVRVVTRREIQLVATRINQPVRTSDIGVGVSQILPVVVAALDPDRPAITAIEQPELHVHPRMQVELGDLFAQRVGQGGIFLIETHSEHLLLRIMRRMRQTCDGTLPGGAPRLRPEDVAVLLVEPDGAETLVREMPLNERGDLVEAWPGGFFEEDMREIFDVREPS